jgi:hypothetical protein
MSTQEALFHEDFQDSLRHLVKALGGVEVVGADLWPAKTRKQAGSWLSDCLNPERPGKLDIEEIVALLRLGREAGIHCAIYQLCAELNYERPGIVAPKTPRQLIAEKRIRLALEQKALADEEAALERAEAAAQVRAVR